MNSNETDTQFRTPHSAIRTRKGIGGPKTEEGKRRSSLNALKHGLTAKSSHAMEAITEEFNIDFDEIQERMRGHYQPADPLEDELVHRISRCLYRLAIAEAMERRVFERNPNPTKPGSSYDRILKYERLVDIHLHRAIFALTHKRQGENKNNSQNELPPSLY